MGEPIRFADFAIGHVHFLEIVLDLDRSVVTNFTTLDFISISETTRCERPIQSSNSYLENNDTLGTNHFRG